ncbi:MAG: NAD(P)H-dependent glycerol-3-phosphate dehydrogenase [Alphaproteobacteria bacterium]
MSILPAISVLGAGAWGTALANAAARAGRPTLIWAREPAIADEINGRHSNESRLPGCKVDERVRASSALTEACAAPIILVVVPAQSLRGLLEAVSMVTRRGTPIVVCAKGIERSTGRFMSEVVEEAAPMLTPAILSGPSFAADVVKGLPTAVTVAARDEDIARLIAGALGSSTFRLYHTTDLRGVEIGGAAKNVLAIAAGIVRGRGLGASAEAALVARGFAELARFGAAHGARSETLTGLSGLGDLILTCSGPQSRNFSLGLALGRGEVGAADGPLAEGAATAEILTEMAKIRGIEMPIATAVADVIAQRLNVDQAVSALLSRPQKAE